MFQLFEFFNCGGVFVKREGTLVDVRQLVDDLDGFDGLV
jgi:hypothetical protein